MKTIHNIQDESELPLNGSVITLGNFDGIHPGHVALLNRITDISIEKKIPSLVITYHPNPARVLGKKQNFKDIFSFDIKRNLLNNCGIDYFYPIPFTPEFAGMNAYDFLRDVLVKKLKARHIVIGFNHCFGKGREGNFSFLKKHSREFNYDVEEIEEVKFDGEVISSSLIRKNIQEGNIKKANKMLDRIFYLRGTVGRGFQRGKKIGFPTANLIVESEYIIIPGDGVYACLININNKLYKAIVNIGNNPTFENREKSIEGHVLGYHGDLYGKDIEFHFFEKIRDEMKFNSIEDLIEQIYKDRERAYSMLAGII